MSKDFNSAWLADYEHRQKHKAGVEIQDSKQRQCKATLETDSSREAQGTKCPHVKFTLCRVRLLDVDAKYHSVKDLLDGLQHAGLISGDQEGQVSLEVNQIKVSHYKEEQTIIEIEL